VVKWVLWALWGVWVKEGSAVDKSAKCGTISC